MSLAKSSTQIFLTRAFRLGISFFAGILLARWLQPEGRGAYSLVNQFVFLAAAFGGMSINQSTIHFSGSGRFTKEQQVSNSVFSAAIFAVLTSIFILALRGPLGSVIPLDWTVTAIVIVLIPISIIDAYLKGILQSLYRFGWINILEIVQAVLLATFVTLCYLYLTPSFEKALYAWAMSMILSVAVLIVIVYFAIPFRLKFEFNIFREHLSFGLKAHMSTVVGLLCLRLDQYILGYLSDRAAVGKYAIAVSLSELLLFLPASVAFVLLPKASHSSQEGYVETVKKACTVVFLISLVAALALALISKPLVVYGFGEAYSDSVKALWLLLPGVVCLSITTITTPYFLGRLGKPHLGSIVAIVVLLSNTAFNLVLIPAYGINGAAISSTASYMIATVLNLYIFLQYSGKRHFNAY